MTRFRLSTGRHATSTTVRALLEPPQHPHPQPLSHTGEGRRREGANTETREEKPKAQQATVQDLNADAQSCAAWIARFLKARVGRPGVFGLQGGHIQPIWDHCARLGIRIVDVRETRAPPSTWPTPMPS